MVWLNKLIDLFTDSKEKVFISGIVGVVLTLFGVPEAKQTVVISAITLISGALITGRAYVHGKTNEGIVPTDLADQVIGLAKSMAGVATPVTAQHINDALAKWQEIQAKVAETPIAVPVATGGVAPVVVPSPSPVSQPKVAVAAAPVIRPTAVQQARGAVPMSKPIPVVTQSGSVSPTLPPSLLWFVGLVMCFAATGCGTSPLFQAGAKAYIPDMAADAKDYVVNIDTTSPAAVKSARLSQVATLESSVADLKTIDRNVVMPAFHAVEPWYTAYVNADATLDPDEKSLLLGNVAKFNKLATDDANRPLSLSGGK